MGFWPVVLNVIKNSDVVLLVVDARMPEISRNSEIIERVRARKKRLVIVFNKIDLVSKNNLEELKKLYYDSYFISGKKKKGIGELKNYLVNLSENWNRSSLRVGIVGYPNVGKSTIINLLVPSARAKVKQFSGTTKKTQWVRDGKLRIMDSPGVIPFGDRGVDVGIMNAKSPHKVKDIQKVAFRIVEFLRNRGGVLERYYGVGKCDSDYELFLAIGKKKGYLIKGGEVDDNRTAMKIVEDWQEGKIRFG